MKNKNLTIKDGALAFLVAFLISQLFIFAGQLITSAILAMLDYSQAKMTDFFQSATGNLITQLCQFAAFLVIFIYYLKKSNLKQECKIEKTKPKLYILFLMVGIVTMFALSYFVNYFALFLNLLDIPTLTLGYEITSTKNYFISIISLAVLPAIAEELMFRGLIFNSFKQKGRLVAILVSSISFTLFHFNLSQLFYPFLFGLVLAIAYSYTNNIIVPISVHFTNNFLNLTIQYFSKGGNSFSPSSHIIVMTIIGIIIFIAVLTFLVYLLSKKEKQEQKEVAQEEGKEVTDVKKVTKKPATQTSRIKSSLNFMKSDAFIVALSFAIMVAFYIGLAILGA